MSFYILVVLCEKSFTLNAECAGRKGKCARDNRSVQQRIAADRIFKCCLAKTVIIIFSSDSELSMIF